MVEETPSPQVVLQRIRNRVIEDLETTASYDEQRRCQLIGTEPWERLRSAAVESLAVFQQRGRLSEDVEAAEPAH